MSTVTRGLYRHEDADAAAPAAALLNRLGDSLDAPWTAYTPGIGATSGVPGANAASGRYRQIGRTVHVAVIVSLTAVGSASGSLVWNLPVPAVVGIGWVGICREDAVTGTMGGCQVANATQATITLPIAAPRVYRCSLTYEAS